MARIIKSTSVRQFMIRPFNPAAIIIVLVAAVALALGATRTASQEVVQTSVSHFVEGAQDE